MTLLPLWRKSCYRFLWPLRIHHPWLDMNPCTVGSNGKHITTRPGGWQFEPYNCQLYFCIVRIKFFRMQVCIYEKFDSSSMSLSSIWFLCSCQFYGVQPEHSQEFEISTNKTWTCTAWNWLWKSQMLSLLSGRYCFWMLIFFWWRELKATCVWAIVRFGVFLDVPVGIVMNCMTLNHVTHPLYPHHQQFSSVISCTWAAVSIFQVLMGLPSCGLLPLYTVMIQACNYHHNWANMQEET
jgi:hypothetical protein